MGSTASKIMKHKIKPLMIFFAISLSPYLLKYVYASMEAMDSQEFIGTVAYTGPTRRESETVALIGSSITNMIFERVKVWRSCNL